LAGSDAKVDFIVNELGFDAGINYKVSQSRLHEELKAKCPDGIDLFIDNVGGPVADAMLEHMNDWGRWIIIGLIGDYDRPISENTGLKPQGYVLGKRLRMQGFVVHDYAPRYAEAQKRLSSWIREGRLKFREHIVGGLENAPAAFLDMLAGGNVGKVLVRTGPDPIGAA
jgi:NADPH-dependent curcumin reductase CurA